MDSRSKNNTHNSTFTIYWLYASYIVGQDHIETRIESGGK
jgi:hypothetical protein